MPLALRPRIGERDVKTLRSGALSEFAGALFFPSSKVEIPYAPWLNQQIFLLEVLRYSGLVTSAIVSYRVVGACVTSHQSKGGPRVAEVHHTAENIERASFCLFELRTSASAAQLTASHVIHHLWPLVRNHV